MLVLAEAKHRQFALGCILAAISWSKRLGELGGKCFDFMQFATGESSLKRLRSPSACKSSRVFG